MTYASEVTTDAPICWLRFNEASGATAADASGLGHTGIYTSVTYAATGLQSGDTDKAVTLNGTTSRIEVPAGTWKNVGNAFTVEMLVKMNSGDGTARVVFDGDNTSPGQWGIQLGTGNKVTYMLNTSGDTAFKIGAGNFLAGMTTHIAMTWDGAQWNCYLAGGLDYSQALAGSWPAGQGTAPWTIGAARSVTDTYSTWLPATIDEFAFYNKALSPARIFAHAAQAALTQSQGRLDAEYAEALILPSAPLRDLDAIYAEALVLPDNTQRRLDAFYIEVLHPSTPASPISPGIVAVGAPTTPIRILHDDGVWRALRPLADQ